MTEIKIEKKKIIWPWLLLGLGVAALLVYYLAKNYSNQELKEEPEGAKLINTKGNNSMVQDYVSFIESDTNKMTLDHAFTHKALYKLTDAINAISGQVGYQVNADLEKVKKYADMIIVNPFETTHADNIRLSSDILTNELQNIQKTYYPELSNEITELKNASSSIKPEILALDQKETIKAFFSKAAYLLKKVNETN